MAHYQCRQCGKDVKRTPSKTRGIKIFCSMKCSNKYYANQRAKTRKPTDKTAQQTIQQLAIFRKQAKEQELI